MDLSLLHMERCSDVDCRCMPKAKVCLGLVAREVITEVSVCGVVPKGSKQQGLQVDLRRQLPGLCRILHGVLGLGELNSYGLEEGLKGGNVFFLERGEQTLDHESHLSDF